MAICLCSQGFTGQYCQKPNNQNIPQITESSENKSEEIKTTKTCPKEIPNPCLNDGICNFSKLTGQISCTCNSLYYGTFCEKNNSFCNVNPCQNGLFFF